MRALVVIVLLLSASPALAQVQSSSGEMGYANGAYKVGEALVNGALRGGDDAPKPVPYVLTVAEGEVTVIRAGKEITKDKGLTESFTLQEKDFIRVDLHGKATVTHGSLNMVFGPLTMAQMDLAYDLKEGKPAVLSLLYGHMRLAARRWRGLQTFDLVRVRTTIGQVGIRSFGAEGTLFYVHVNRKEGEFYEQIDLLEKAQAESAAPPPPPKLEAPEPSPTPPSIWARNNQVLPSPTPTASATPEAPAEPPLALVLPKVKAVGDLKVFTELYTRVDASAGVVAFRMEGAAESIVVPQGSSMVHMQQKIEPGVVAAVPQITKFPVGELEKIKKALEF